MNRILLALAVLLVALSTSAATRISLTVTVTNPPVTGATLTINASTRYWTNGQSATTILTNLTSKNASATNLFNNYASYSIGSGITHVMSGTNSIVFTAPLGVSLSGSSAGSWATTVLSTQSGPSTFSAVWPMENMVGETNRTNQGSSLVYGLGIYSTNAFPTNATALTNFITKGAVVGPQHITSQLRISGNINNGTSGLSVSNLVNYGAAIRSEGSGGNSFQVGSNATATANFAIAVGNSSVAAGLSSTAVGTGATATNNYTVAVGTGATASEESAIAVGNGPVASGQYAVVIGDSDAQAVGYSDIAIGRGAVANGGSGIAIGAASYAAYTNSAAFGQGATATTTNQIRLGTSTETVSIPGMVAVEGSLTNSTFKGTNVLNGRLDLKPGARTSLANGYNSGTILGTNVYFRMSGPSAAYTNAGFAAAVDGTWHKLQFDNPGLSYTILHDSGLEATAANRVYTGTGALVNSTNNPAFVELIYDANVSRWRVIAIR